MILASALDVIGRVMVLTNHRADLSRRLKRRSKPTVDRQSGVGSKVLIAISSVEQHGYESVGHHVRRPFAAPTRGAPGTRHCAAKFELEEIN